jgi:hypothetical protein
MARAGLTVRLGAMELGIAEEYTEKASKSP